MVPVLNHSNRMIEFMHMRREAGTPGIGPTHEMIRFLPGNNSVSEEDLEKCKKNPNWEHYTKRLVHKDLLAKGRKYALLEVGAHDEDLEVEAQELGDRMHEIRMRQRS